MEIKYKFKSFVFEVIKESYDLLAGWFGYDTLYLVTEQDGEKQCAHDCQVFLLKTIRKCLASLHMCNLSLFKLTNYYIYIKKNGH